MTVHKVYEFQPQAQYSKKELKELLEYVSWLVMETSSGNKDVTNLCALSEIDPEDYKASPISIQRHIDSCHGKLGVLIEIVRVIEVLKAEEAMKTMFGKDFVPAEGRGVLLDSEYKKKPLKPVTKGEVTNNG